MEQADSDLDECQLAELREDLDDAFEGFVERFLQSCSSLPGELAADLSRDDLAGAAARAHRLKGTAGYLGAGKLVEGLGKLQREAEAGNRAATANQVEAVSAAVEALVPRLASHLGNS